jgi:hypothetical protein
MAVVAPSVVACLFLLGQPVVTAQTPKTHTTGWPRKVPKCGLAVESPKMTVAQNANSDSKTVIHLVHGIFDSDGGERSIARVKPYFESTGWSVQVFSYGWIGPLGARFLNPRIVRQLIATIRANDVGCAHSNGCALLHRATHMGAPLSMLVYVNPALVADAPRATQVRSVQVYYNDGDDAVQFAAFMRLVAPWAPFGDPLWGDMGARGSRLSASSNENAKPHDIISYLLNCKNTSASKWPWWQVVLQVTVGLPLGLFYLLCLAPLEVILAYFHNNVRARTAEMRLDFSRLEDAKFVTFGFILPVLLWATMISWVARHRSLLP